MKQEEETIEIEWSHTPFLIGLIILSIFGTFGLTYVYLDNKYQFTSQERTVNDYNMKAVTNYSIKPYLTGHVLDGDIKLVGCINSTMIMENNTILCRANE